MEELIFNRRYLHSIPEVGFDLPKTVDFIKKRLREYGAEPIEPCNGAVAAYYEFGRPATVMLRADIDALPITEETNLPFASIHKGAMHACGHDAHAAMLLGLAKFFAKGLRPRNNVLLVFQPAEETGGGAERIINSGILDRYSVAAAAALHLWPGIPLGKGVTAEGPFLAGSSEINVDFFGTGGHVQDKYSCIDAVKLATDFLNRVFDYKRENTILHFGRIMGGEVRNSVAASATIEGTMRWFHESERAGAVSYIKSSLSSAAESDPSLYALEFSKGYPVLENSQFVVAAAKKALGEDLLLEGRLSLASDDFAYIAKAVPSVYIKLGIGDAPPLHSSEFNFDESILIKGFEMLKKLANMDISSLSVC